MFWNLNAVSPNPYIWDAQNFKKILEATSKF